MPSEIGKFTPTFLQTLLSKAVAAKAQARKAEIELHETPVGFKYIDELIRGDKILTRGEERAGLSIHGHVPEQDGVLAGLLRCEMSARRGASLGKQLQAVFGKVGSFYPLRENFRLTPEVKQKFTEELRTDPSDFYGSKVAKRTDARTDGLKLLFADRPIDRACATDCQARSRWCGSTAKRGAGKTSPN